jgi:hypothetical protein
MSNELTLPWTPTMREVNMLADLVRGYEKRIAELEAQLAQPVPSAGGQWTPLEDGEFNLDGNGISIEDNGKTLIIFDDIIGDAVAELPDNIRLCRLTGDAPQ